MGELIVNGCKLWYELEGSGTNHLLQIGGLGFGHEGFNMITESMREHFRVIECDLRGYGSSDRPSQEYSMEIWADDTAALLDALGVGPVYVHGSSMGGMVALKLAAKYPEKVAGLIVSCAFAKPDSASRARFAIQKALARAYGMGGRPLALEMASQALSRAFLDAERGSGVVDEIQRVLERNCSLESFCSACDAVAAMDLSADLDKVRAPTLVIAGEEDILTPLEQGPQGLGNREIADRVANGELYVMRGAAHSIFMEAPLLSVAVAVDFFRRVSLQRDSAAAAGS